MCVRERENVCVTERGDVRDVTKKRGRSNVLGALAGGPRHRQHIRHQPLRHHLHGPAHSKDIYPFMFNIYLFYYSFLLFARTFLSFIFKDIDFF